MLDERPRDGLARLDAALAALETRAGWTGFADIPSERAYGQGAAEAGKAAFERLRGQPFVMDGMPAERARAGAERSPYGLALDIAYPRLDPDEAVAAAKLAWGPWRAAEPARRLQVLLRALERLNARSFEIAHAAMHTSGQGFMMAFQAAGPHAQDRALEALALARRAMGQVPPRAVWRKRTGKDRHLVVERAFKILPRGIGLVIGCSTFPTWNAYPGLFASLAVGAPVIVKPHPGAILPLAITLREMRAVLVEEGFDPNLVLLAPDTPDEPCARAFARHPDIRLIDYTGGTAFGDWLEGNATQAELFTEKAGLNAVVIASTDDLAGLARNLAFSLSLYSGQMCTAPQNIFIPQDGIDLGGGRRASFREVGDAIAQAVDKLVDHPKLGPDILGAVQSERTAARIEALARGATVLRPARRLAHPDYPDARVISPLLLGASLRDAEWREERFGPVAFLIAVPDGEAGLRAAAEGFERRGALSFLVHGTDEAFLARAREVAMGHGVPLSVNLTGELIVNHSLAFADPHVTGANPAGNATLTDLDFIARRFRLWQERRDVSAHDA